MCELLSELYFFGDFRSQQVYFKQLSRKQFNEQYFDKRRSRRSRKAGRGRM